MARRISSVNASPRLGIVTRSNHTSKPEAQRSRYSRSTNGSSSPRAYERNTDVIRELSFRIDSGRTWNGPATSANHGHASYFPKKTREAVQDPGTTASYWAARYRIHGVGGVTNQSRLIGLASGRPTPRLRRGPRGATLALFCKRRDARIHRLQPVVRRHVELGESRIS